MLTTPCYSYQQFKPFVHADYSKKALTSYKGTYISCSDQVLLKIIEEAIDRVISCGYSAPKIIVTDKTEFLYTTGCEIIDKPDELVAGDTATHSGIVYINPYQFKYDADKAFDTFFHESGHINHLAKVLSGDTNSYIYKRLTGQTHRDESAFIKLKPLIKVEVSEYATTSPFEFIAEVFRMKIEGKIISDEIYKLYEKYEGP